MEFRNELREDCYWCHGKLTPHLSETVMGKCGDKEIIFKNVPRLECKKCSFYYSAEPFQEQKTKIFQEHLRSLPFLRQYRTKIVPQMRCQIFRQIVQKFRRHTDVCRGIFVQDGGKYASRCGAKPQGGLCAVLP